MKESVTGSSPWRRQNRMDWGVSLEQTDGIAPHRAEVKSQTLNWGVAVRKAKPVLSSTALVFCEVGWRIISRGTASSAAIHYTFSRLDYSSLNWFSFVVLIIVWMCPKNFFLTLNTRHFSQRMWVRQWLKKSLFFLKKRSMMWCIVVTTENILPHICTE